MDRRLASSTFFFAAVGLCLLLSLFDNAGVQKAEAWGVEGHAIIAQIAFNRLTDTAQKNLLKYIAPYPGVQNVSSQADEYDHTPAGAWSAPLHYISMPKNAMYFQMDPDCPDPPSCVVQAIENYTAILQKSLDNPEWGNGEPSPAAFLIHFIGDVHQPLHCGYAYDDDATSVYVSWFGESTSLHSVWDTSIIEKWESDTAAAISQLEQMIADNETAVNNYMSVISPSSWANESFQIVRTDCYNYNGEVQFDIEDLADPRKHVFSDPYLGDGYYDHNKPIVQTQLIKGAVRLGSYLQELFG